MPAHLHTRPAPRHRTTPRPPPRASGLRALSIRRRVAPLAVDRPTSASAQGMTGLSRSAADLANGRLPPLPLRLGLGGQPGVLPPGPPIDLAAQLAPALVPAHRQLARLQGRPDRAAGLQVVAA